MSERVVDPKTVKSRAKRAWAGNHVARCHDVTEKTLRYRVGPGQVFIEVKKDAAGRIKIVGEKVAKKKVAKKKVAKKKVAKKV